MKVFLISHIADADGVMPVILTDLTFTDYDYQLLEIDEVDEYMNKCLDNNFFDSYDQVFMVDLCIGESVAKRIDDSKLKNKILVLDHHYANLSLNKYSFIKVIDEENGIKESGTSLYYKYLLEHYPNQYLICNSVAYMVTLVRLGDTWQWKEFDVFEARDLSTILSYYGNDKFINNYCRFLRKNKEFYFSEAEKVLIDIDNKRKIDYIEEAKEDIIFKEISGYKVGIVFKELYRSELGNALAEYYQDEVDLIMIINLNRSLSFRGIKDNVNVSDFAQIFGGKGHKLAAGAPLPENFKEKILMLLLKSNDLGEL